MKAITYSHDFIKDWLDAADAHTGDAFFEFFCRFITLNHLYFPFASELYYDTSKRKLVEKGERRGLECFLKNTLPRLPKFEIPNSVKELLNPVQDVKSVRNGGIAKGFLTPFGENWAVDYVDRQRVRMTDESRHNWLVIKVFLRIYQVRCNLFHGEKNHGTPHDVTLVKESALVLKSFLKLFMKHGRSHYIFTVESESGHYDSSCLEER